LAQYFFILSKWVVLIIARILSMAKRGRRRKGPRLVRRPRSPNWAIAYFEEKTNRTEYWSTGTADLASATMMLGSFECRTGFDPIPMREIAIGNTTFAALAAE
jgi:hypothetical protein